MFSSIVPGSSCFCGDAVWLAEWFRNELYEAPLSIFRLPVIIRVGNGIFQCRVYGEVKQKLTQAQRHLLSHFFAHEIARNIDLKNMPETL